MYRHCIEIPILMTLHWVFLMGYFLQAFITQDPEDRDFLVKSLRSFDVPVINHVPSDSRHTNPFRTTEEVLLLFHWDSALWLVVEWLIVYSIALCRCLNLAYHPGLIKCLKLPMLSKKFWLVNLDWITQYVCILFFCSMYSYKLLAGLGIKIWMVSEEEPRVNFFDLKLSFWIFFSVYWLKGNRWKSWSGQQIGNYGCLDTRKSLPLGQIPLRESRVYKCWFSDSIAFSFMQYVFCWFFSCE